MRDLGVVFDKYLTFYDHISGICKSTDFHLRSIGIIRNLITFVIPKVRFERVVLAKN